MRLRFDELSPREFEELCLALVRALGHSETEHTGAAGMDRGWDVRSRDPEGRLWCIQCKRVQTIEASKAVRELKKVLDRPEGGSPDVWALMASRDITTTVREALEAEAAGRCELRFFGRSDLEGLLEENPRVRDRFFAGGDPKARIAYLSAARADRDFASVFRRDLQAALRHAVGASWSVQWDDPTGDKGLPEVPERASWGIVLVSPEALADRHLLSLWRTGLCQGVERGARRLLAVSIATAPPWPSWLAERFDRVDLRSEPDPYRLDLSTIVSKWIGETEEGLLAGVELEGPGPTASRLPWDLHSALVEWLALALEKKTRRQLLSMVWGLGLPTALDEHDSAALRASAAIVLTRGGDDPVAGALRLIDGTRRTLDEAESAGRLSDLDALAQRLRESPSPTSVDRGLLPTWLSKVVTDHERLVDYFQQRHELDLLDRVYVELEMAADRLHDPDLDGVSEKGKLEKGRSLAGRSLGIEEVLSLGPGDGPRVTRRWVVKGDPGSGKTTLLRHLACKLAQDDRRRWVPVFQSLPVLARSREPLIDRIERTMAAQTGRAGLAAVLDREGQEGRLLLLLDGLDEVGAELREETESYLRRLSERWPKTPIVVSTRPIGYRRFATDFRELQLQPLDRRRRLEFLAGWFGRADGSQEAGRAESALGQLEASGLEELAGNPLYLTLMAMLLEQGAAPEKNRSRLYDQVFELLLGGRHKHGKPDPIERPKLVRETLRLLAFTMTVDNRDAEPKPALEERLYSEELEAVRFKIRDVPRWDGPLHHFLDDLAEKVGILGPHDGDDADWRFWHRTFKEALTAEHLASLPEEELLEQAASLAGQESRWAEPYALLTGQVDDADALVRQLVETNRALGLRALATAQNVKDGTIDEILQLTDDLEERSRVFEQVPEIIGDGERAAVMIDRLRRRTRNGDDLF
ncbi:MAG: NACHT domain-containing protein [Holophagales bacterium]|nr:NACHT domain-containing protein [Holophagales bacterium]